MKEHLKLIYTRLASTPLLGRYAYGAKASYITHRELQRLGMGIALIWRESTWIFRGDHSSSSLPARLRISIHARKGLMKEWSCDRPGGHYDGVQLIPAPKDGRILIAMGSEVDEGSDAKRPSTAERVLLGGGFLMRRCAFLLAMEGNVIWKNPKLPLL